MLKYVFGCVALLLVASGSVSAQQQAHDAAAGHVMVTPEAIKWQPLPRDWANGPPPPPADKAVPEVAIIWGDPTKEGAPFLFRIRLQAGSGPVAPHFHPTDEHLTVLSGVFCMGMGDKYDEKACKDMPAGSHMIMPKGVHHFAVNKNAVVEVYGIGPFKINWLR
jgi:hypothetical protein